MPRILIGLLLCLSAGACNRASDAADKATSLNGRYHGIGVVDAGRLWGEMKLEADQKDEALARLKDDEHIIVTMDGRSGEVRQCGDHSGICVAMNPWNRETVAKAPVPLREHGHGAFDAASSAESDATPGAGGKKQP